MDKQRGFTLVELLVVIAIIALLMAILMPALARVRNQAQAVRCMANLKQWGYFFMFYTDDNEGYFNEGWNQGEETLWMNALRPYYKDNWDLLLCPTATRVVGNQGDWGTYKATWRDCDLPGGGKYRYTFSYGINNWTNYMTKDRGSGKEIWFWKSTKGVKNANTIPLFGDSTWHDAWPLHTDEPPKQPDEFGSGNTGTTQEMKHFCINRHDGFINMLFMDWSTKKVGLKELWTLKWHREFRNKTGPYTKGGYVRPSMWPAWMRRFKDY